MFSTGAIPRASQTLSRPWFRWRWHSPSRRHRRYPLQGRRQGPDVFQSAPSRRLFESFNNLFGPWQRGRRHIAAVRGVWRAESCCHAKDAEFQASQHFDLRRGNGVERALWSRGPWAEARRLGVDPRHWRSEHFCGSSKYLPSEFAMIFYQLTFLSSLKPPALVLSQQQAAIRRATSWRSSAQTTSSITEQTRTGAR